MSYPSIARRGVYGDLYLQRALRLRQRAEEGAWRAETVSTRSVRECVSETRESTTTYDG